MAVKHAFGTTLTWNSQTVTKLHNIGGVEVTAEMVDTSTHQSTSAFTEKLPGMLSVSDIPIEGYFDPADTNGQVAMVTDCTGRTSRTVVITFPDTIATWTATAYLSSIKIGDNAINGMIPFSATLSVTGVPALAITASNNVTALTVTTATLYPTFAQGTYSYVGTSTGTGLTFTPTFAAGTCSITNGTATVVTTSTVASGSLALGASGTQTTFTMTIQETGKAAKVYTFIIAKTA